jgi:Flp pilus assembly protein TadD
MPDHDEAIRLKPHFAMAHSRRGAAYQAIGWSAEAARNFAKAKELP